MLNHVDMHTRALMLAMRVVHMTWHAISVHTGMSISALCQLARRAKKSPQTNPITVPGCKPGSGQKKIIMDRMEQLISWVLRDITNVKQAKLKEKLHCLRKMSVQTICCLLNQHRRKHGSGKIQKKLTLKLPPEIILDITLRTRRPSMRKETFSFQQLKLTDMWVFLDRPPAARHQKLTRSRSVVY